MYQVRPIHPLTIPEGMRLRGEADDCAEPPVAPGLDPQRCFPGVKAWAIGQEHASWELGPRAYALFVPEEYLTPGMDEERRSGRGTLVTQAVGSPVLDVRDVEADDVFTIARAIRRALS